MANYLATKFPKQELTKENIDQHIITWETTFPLRVTHCVCSREDFNKFLEKYNLYKGEGHIRYVSREEVILYGPLKIIWSDGVKNKEWFLTKQNKRLEE